VIGLFGEKDSENRLICIASEFSIRWIWNRGRMVDIPK
jgi:hypothetical protein